MSSTITVVLNGEETELSDDFGATPEEFLEDVWGNSLPHKLYRVDDLPAGADVTEEHRCSEPLVVSEGDEFLAVPKYVTGGG